MTDIQAILKELQDRAAEVAEQIDVDTRVEEAKDLAGKVKDRIAEDPQAQAAAIGGGALLALLMATRGGRRTLGTVAKTGMVAGLGALAYSAWKARAGGDTDGDHFPDESESPEFSRALVETMAMAASADGVIDADERAAIEQALAEAGADPNALNPNMGFDQMVDKISGFADSPNQAHQLYAAACMGCRAASVTESAFLSALADRLAIHPRTADELRNRAG